MKALKITLSNTFRQHYALFYLALFCVILAVVRTRLTSSHYLFLIWNLFLAYIPMMISTSMLNNIQLIEKKNYFYPLLFCWLLFLPNAPYLITDFIHLNNKAANGAPIWYDILTIISFATSGILAGLASMKQIFTLLSLKYNPLLAWFCIAASCFLSGFGIYLGKFLRFNSWDIISKPFELLIGILKSLTGSTALGVTMGFGFFLLLLFHFYTSNNDS